MTPTTTSERILALPVPHPGISLNDIARNRDFYLERVIENNGFTKALEQAAALAAEADAELAELRAIRDAVVTHYSCSLDWRPGYVQMAHKSLKEQPE